MGEVGGTTAELSDAGLHGGHAEKRQCFRVRAGVFARAHGRPDGVPGRIAGARAKGLPIQESMSDRAGKNRR